MATYKSTYNSSMATYQSTYNSSMLTYKWIYKLPPFPYSRVADGGLNRESNSSPETNSLNITLIWDINKNERYDTTFRSHHDFIFKW